MQQRGGFWLAVVFLLLTQGAHALTLVQLNTPQRWRRLEFRVSGVPTVSNPFDPNVVTLDATFTLPSGQTRRVPGFWYRNYTRALSNGSEVLTTQGSAEWRVRFCPTEVGNYAVSVALTLNGAPSGSPATTTFSVTDRATTGPQGYVRLAAGNRYFATDRGDPLPLNGANVCWHGSAGTYDYDTWFDRMAQSGENFARIWMCPWAFGIEYASGQLTNYRLNRAWQLDYLLELAEQKGIYLMLCLDYHGMFETQPDYWGGNNYWPQNPYNTALGGPCANQNAFFTNATAKAIYKKRLRYLIARYGYSPRLLCWEFFNEIDNVYSYLNATDVANWHAEMGNWLKANDPFGHLVTTSLTGSSDRPEIWNLSQLDFAQYHSYGMPQPATGLASVMTSFHDRYHKPALVGEYGTDWRGWNRQTVDPYLRGFRQGIWSGALNGSAGTSMSWWWEEIQNENLYSTFQAITTFTRQTQWGRGTWTPVNFLPASNPPDQLGDPIPNGQPFTATLTPNGSWGGIVPGVLAIANSGSAGRAGIVLNSFVHGAWHAELRCPFRLEVWTGQNARMVMHLNSVSDSATIQVKVDGSSIFQQNYPNIDGQYSVNNEYNIDIPVTLPSGRHRIEIVNPGGDWFFLDWVRMENLLPAEYANNWQPQPLAVGITNSTETLAYVVSPEANFPMNALTANLPLQTGTTITLLNWPTGNYRATWHSTLTGLPIGETNGITANGDLILSVPDFREDLAARIIGLVSVSGVVTLEGCANPAQAITMEFRPTDGSPAFTRPVTLAANGSFTLTDVPRRNYKVHVKGAKWLAKNVIVSASTGDITNVALLLKAGDANDDNIVDVEDLNRLILAFDADPTAPNWNQGVADFNCDDLVSVDDLALLIRNFDAEGDL